MTSSDWAIVASLATAGGTLVLAVATFSSVRSSNRTARAAERSLQAGLRPLLVQTRDDDPVEHIMWGDRHWADVGGGATVAEFAPAPDGSGDVVYLAIPVRNAGAGLAVLHGWSPSAVWNNAGVPHAEPDDFRRMTRDLYIAPGDTGFWQGAMRDPSEPLYGELVEAVREPRMFSIDLLYGDSEGGQRTISRFSLVPTGNGAWTGSIGKHWNLDRDDPR